MDHLSSHTEKIGNFFRDSSEIVAVKKLVKALEFQKQCFFSSNGLEMTDFWEHCGDFGCPYLTVYIFI